MTLGCHCGSHARRLVALIGIYENLELAAVSVWEFAISHPWAGTGAAALGEDQIGLAYSVALHIECGNHVMQKNPVVAEFEAIDVVNNGIGALTCCSYCCCR